MFWIVVAIIVAALLAGAWGVDRRFRGARLDRKQMSDQREAVAGKMMMKMPRGHTNGEYNGHSF